MWNRQFPEAEHVVALLDVGKKEGLKKSVWCRNIFWRRSVTRGDTFPKIWEKSLIRKKNWHLSLWVNSVKLFRVVEEISGTKISATKNLQKKPYRDIRMWAYTSWRSGALVARRCVHTRTRIQNPTSNEIWARRELTPRSPHVIWYVRTIFKACWILMKNFEASTVGSQTFSKACHGEIGFVKMP